MLKHTISVAMLRMLTWYSLGRWVQERNSRFSTRPDPDDIGQFIRHRPGVHPLPQLVHEKDLLTRTTAAGVHHPFAEPTESPVHVESFPHDQWVKTYPTSCQGEFTFAGCTTWLEFKPGGRLAAIVEDEPASGRLVQKIFESEAGFAAAWPSRDQDDGRGERIVRHGYAFAVLQLRII